MVSWWYNKSIRQKANKVFNVQNLLRKGEHRHGSREDYRIHQFG